LLVERTKQILRQTEEGDAPDEFARHLGTQRDKNHSPSTS
jgi:hypothetical protein